MTESKILHSRAGAVATITLNRPDLGNAIDMEAARDFMEAAEACAEDPQTRCVLLIASGPRFCVGGDLQSFAALGDGLSDHLKELTGYFHRGIARLAHMEKPLVTAINGAAAGAGVSLGILGDIVLAGSSAHFTWAYGSIGFTPDGGISWLLPRLIGLRRTQEFALLGTRVLAKQAAEIGMVTAVVEDGSLLKEARQLSERLATSATYALGRTRRLLFSSFTNGFQTQMEEESRSIAEAATSDEGQLGLSAFIAKRRPVFL